MVAILSNLGARCVLARPQEKLLAKTYTHNISLVWTTGAALLIPGLAGMGILVALLFRADILFLVGLVLALPFLFFVIRHGTVPFQEIVVTDRSIYRITWGRLRFWWGVIRFTEIPLESIARIEISQAVLGRLLGYGDILLRLKVKPDKIKLEYVPHPDQVKDLIQRAISQVALLVPIQERDVQMLNVELQGLCDQRLIDQEELESAKHELFGQHIV